MTWYIALLAALVSAATLASPALANLPPTPAAACTAGSPIATRPKELVGRAFNVNRDTGRFLLVTEAGAVIRMSASPEMVREIADGALVAVEVAAETSESASTDHCI
jgi:hypothetical protein